jgi:hypothetical protein
MKGTQNTRKNAVFVFFASFVVEQSVLTVPARSWIGDLEQNQGQDNRIVRV